MCRKSTKQYFTTDCSVFSPIRNNINYYEHQVMKIFKIHNRAIVVAIVTVTFPPRGPQQIKCNTVLLGHTTNFHTGRLGPFLQARTDKIFTQKWYPFHIPCLELCTPFTCCKCTVLSIGIHDKNRTLSQLYKTMKFIGSTYDTFLYAFTNFTSQIRNLSYT